MENVENTVRERIASKIVNQVTSKIGNLVGDKVWIKVRDPIGEQTSVYEQVRNKKCTTKCLKNAQNDGKIKQNGRK